MEMICLVADLQSSGESGSFGQRRGARGKLDRGRGPVATVLVQDGTLRAERQLCRRNVYGKVRAMFDDRGAQLEERRPLLPSRFSVWRACGRRAISSSWWPTVTRLVHL